MSAESELPEFGFPSIEFGRRETPWNLKPLLYIGGAATNIRDAGLLMSSGKLGQPRLERIPLLARIHAEINSKIIAGGAILSAKSTIGQIRNFYTWCDISNQSPTLENAGDLFLRWSDYLTSLHRRKIIKPKQLFDRASRVSAVLNEILDLKFGLLGKTRIRKPKAKARSPISRTTEKTSLSDANIFGSTLLDICNALAFETIFGTLPVTINLRNGQTLVEWSRLRPAELVKHLTQENVRKSTKRDVLKHRAEYEAEHSHRTRHALINLRIEAELLIFIAQTQLNLSVAARLKVGKFTYQSHQNGYLVRRAYKNRKKGEVEFQIYSEYRPFFERYLEWRNKIFPGEDDGLLFPQRSYQNRAKHNDPSFGAIRKRCQTLGMRLFGPRKLRKLKINWLSRELQDPNLTAEMAQHSQEVLLRNYLEPDYQTALFEISTFHESTLASLEAPGPVVCMQRSPEAMPGLPPEAPLPDCISPAGCLDCIHHRSFDSFDFAWSLISYRHLKTLELAMFRPKSGHRPPHPAAFIIDRATDKINHFASTNETRAAWVSESLARVAEGNYHPKWDGFIQLLEPDE